MRMVRGVVVFDAANLGSESAFWAGVLGGQVFEDDTWHTVIDSEGRWRVGVQLAPNHVPPEWPDGSPQQVHLDLHVEDPRAAHDEAMALGASLLQPAPDLDSDEGHQVYADPAGHPFCIGWGQPSSEALAAFVAKQSVPQDPGEGSELITAAGPAPGREGSLPSTVRTLARSGAARLARWSQK